MYINSDGSLNTDAFKSFCDDIYVKAYSRYSSDKTLLSDKYSDAVDTVVAKLPPEVRNCAIDVAKQYCYLSQEQREIRDNPPEPKMTYLAYPTWMKA